MRSPLYETEFENKETSQFDAVMGKRNTRYTSREELSDVVLKTLGNPGASRRHLVVPPRGNRLNLGYIMLKSKSLKSMLRLLLSRYHHTKSINLQKYWAIHDRVPSYFDIILMSRPHLV